MSEANRPRRSAAVLTAVGAILVTALGVSSSSPAAVADARDAVELSTDGVAYSRSLSDLFGPMSLVPGDRAGDTFWVRNASDEPAQLTVTPIDVDVPDPVAAAAITLSAAPAGQPGTRLPLGQADPCLVLHAGGTLAPGENIEIVSTLGLGNLDRTDGQGVHIGFSIQVMLSDAQLSRPGDTSCRAPIDDTRLPGPPVGSPADSTPSAPGGLAVTGSTVLAAAALTAFLLLAGFVLVLARRARKGDEDEGAVT